MPKRSSDDDVYVPPEKNLPRDAMVPPPVETRGTRARPAVVIERPDRPDAKRPKTLAKERVAGEADRTSVLVSLLTEGAKKGTTSREGQRKDRAESRGPRRGQPSSAEIARRAAKAKRGKSRKGAEKRVEPEEAEDVLEVLVREELEREAEEKRAVEVEQRLAQVPLNLRRGARMRSSAAALLEEEDDDDEDDLVPFKGTPKMVANLQRELEREECVGNGGGENERSAGEDEAGDGVVEDRGGEGDTRDVFDESTPIEEGIRMESGQSVPPVDNGDGDGGENKDSSTCAKSVVSNQAERASESKRAAVESSKGGAGSPPPGASTVRTVTVDDSKMVALGTTDMEANVIGSFVLRPGDHKSWPSKPFSLVGKVQQLLYRRRCIHTLRAEYRELHRERRRHQGSTDPSPEEEREPADVSEQEEEEAADGVRLLELGAGRRKGTAAAVEAAEDDLASRLEQERLSLRQELLPPASLHQALDVIHRLRLQNLRLEAELLQAGVARLKAPPQQPQQPAGPAREPPVTPGKRGPKKPLVTVTADRLARLERIEEAVERMFTPAQIQCMCRDRARNTIAWGEEDYRSGVALRSVCTNRAYNFVVQRLGYPLPMLVSMRRLKTEYPVLDDLFNSAVRDPALREQVYCPKCNHYFILAPNKIRLAHPELQITRERPQNVKEKVPKAETALNVLNKGGKALIRVPKPRRRRGPGQKAAVAQANGIAAENAENLEGTKKAGTPAYEKASEDTEELEWTKNADFLVNEKTTEDTEKVEAKTAKEPKKKKNREVKESEKLRKILEARKPETKTKIKRVERTVTKMKAMKSVKTPVTKIAVKETPKVKVLLNRSPKKVRVVSIAEQERAVASLQPRRGPCWSEPAEGSAPTRPVDGRGRSPEVQAESREESSDDEWWSESYGERELREQWEQKGLARRYP